MEYEIDALRSHIFDFTEQIYDHAEWVRKLCQNNVTTHEEYVISSHIYHGYHNYFSGSSIEWN